MGIAVVDESAGTLTYAGVGNPRAMIVRARRSASVRENVIRLPSSSGIVGSGYRRLSPDTIPLNPGDLVILYTDGIPGAMDISGYGEALSGNVHWLAEKIIQDWGRKADDAAILVFRSEGT